MKKFIKEHWLLTSILFVALTASAAKIGEDLLKIGKPGSTSDKQIVFDVGGGATNPAITIDYTDKDFTFNKAMKVAGDLLQVGDGTDTNKEVIFDIGAGANNPRFRWNSTDDVLEFSTDGSAYKKIGSGSGGASGVNVLADNNADFETGSPPGDWTASGGTFISETTSPLFGGQSGSWDASALSQTLDSVLAPITEGFLGRKCQAAIEYRYASGSAGDYKLVVRQYDDSGAAEITVGEIGLPVTGSADSETAEIFFDCPDDVADDLRVRVEAGVADPGIIILDDAFIGTGRNSFQLSQAEIYGTVYRAGNGGSCFASVTSGAYVRATYSSCIAYTVTGKVTAPTANTAEIVLEDAPPGRYEVTVVGTFFASTSTSADAQCLVRMSDGTTASPNIAVYGTVNDGIQSGNSISTTFEYSSTGTRTIGIDLRRTSGNGNCFFSNDVAAGGERDVQWIVKRFPLNNSQAITLTTSDYFVEAVIGGSTVNLGAGDVGTPTVVTGGSLTLEPQPNSASVGIACSGSNAVVGATTCSSNEAAGITFNAPTAGRYEVCGTVLNEIRANAVGDRIQTVFSLAETNADSSSVLVQGESLGEHSFQIFAGSGDDRKLGKNVTVCQDFVFGSAGQKFVSMYYEQESDGAPLGSDIVPVDGVGRRHMYFTVKKETEQKPTPIFTDLIADFTVRSQYPTESNLKSCAAIVTSGAVFDQTLGDCFSGVSNPATGAYTVTFNGGYWAVRPVCTCTAVTGDGNGRRTCAIYSAQYDTGQAQAKITSETGGVVNDNFTMRCVGQAN